MQEIFGGPQCMAVGTAGPANLLYLEHTLLFPTEGTGVAAHSAATCRCCYLMAHLSSCLQSRFLRGEAVFSFGLLDGISICLFPHRSLKLLLWPTFENVPQSEKCVRVQHPEKATLME